MNYKGIILDYCLLSVQDQYTAQSLVGKGTKAKNGIWLGR